MTALDMQSKLIDLRKDWIKNNKYIEEARNMSFRIGLNTGTAKVGFMGTDALASYTMMGDTVNLAARLEAAGKDYGVHILASESIYKNVEGRIFARKLDVVRVKGKSQPVVLYEILNRIGEESNNLKEATHYYEIGLGNYLDRNWKEAIACFQRSIQIRGEEDKPSKMLIDRCNMYQSNPPPETWDGVYTRDTK
jgi:adenylate cyclase